MLDFPGLGYQLADTVIVAIPYRLGKHNVDKLPSWPLVGKQSGSSLLEALASLKKTD
jgi:hypothetical protein